MRSKGKSDRALSTRKQGSGPFQREAKPSFSYFNEIIRWRFFVRRCNPFSVFLRSVFSVFRFLYPSFWGKKPIPSARSRAELAAYKIKPRGFIIFIINQIAGRGDTGRTIMYTWTNIISIEERVILFLCVFLGPLARLSLLVSSTILSRLQKRKWASVCTDKSGVFESGGARVRCRCRGMLLFPVFSPSPLWPMVASSPTKLTPALRPSSPRTLNSFISLNPHSLDSYAYPL